MFAVVSNTFVHIYMYALYFSFLLQALTPLEMAERRLSQKPQDKSDYNNIVSAVRKFDEKCMEVCIQ